MSILLCISTLTIFPKTNTLEIITETSLNAWTFTPRYSIEPFPGDQVFLANRLRCSYSFFSNDRISLGVEAGFANRFHFTYFYSYTVWGLDDSDVWFVLNSGRNTSLLARFRLPTGLYNEGLGIGAYCMELYIRKTNIWRNSSAYFGYEWIGANSDKVNYGDKIRLGVEINNWLRVSSYYAFADQGTYYSLYDSPSFALETSLFKNFRLMKGYTTQVIFSQTLLGRDIPISTSISLRISGKPRETKQR
ncbi:hypothetical protein AMJ83_10280 [candidate division WOR_3 bacterium SM23_42]|uniref:Uncharacterized protein n=1 Tax=candidate division WOR_3 bacterium SM23_42 TaxID=1703779 RepID=A0A0S8FPK4_UNCW3|nr:MAG: hypothetical protein AMJ83_10280 [candidate division WOR_3 bacterium SM23_42]